MDLRLCVQSGRRVIGGSTRVLKSYGSGEIGRVAEFNIPVAAARVVTVPVGAGARTNLAAPGRRDWRFAPFAFYLDQQKSTRSEPAGDTHMTQNGSFTNASSLRTSWWLAGVRRRRRGQRAQGCPRSASRCLIRRTTTSSSRCYTRWRRACSSLVRSRHQSARSSAARKTSTYAWRK